MLPGFWMVDTFPFLENLPLMFKPWEREAKGRFARDYEWCKEKLEVSAICEDSCIRS